MSEVPFIIQSMAGKGGAWAVPRRDLMCPKCDRRIAWWGIKFDPEDWANTLPVRGWQGKDPGLVTNDDDKTTTARCNSCGWTRTFSRSAFLKRVVSAKTRVVTL